MKIKAFNVKASDLKPGDLFSTQGNEYWGHPERQAGYPVGEKVYIRTTIPCPESEKEESIYLIKIFKDKEKQ